MKTKLLLICLALAISPLASAQNSITPPSGMVTWLSGDANPQDILNNAMDVKVNGTVTFSPGTVGNAFTFNNSGDVPIPPLTPAIITRLIFVRPNSSGKNRGRQTLIANDVSENFGHITFGFEQIEYYHFGGTSVIERRVAEPDARIGGRQRHPGPGKRRLENWSAR